MDDTQHDIKASLGAIQAGTTLLMAGTKPKGLASELTKASALCSAHKSSPDPIIRAMVGQLHTIVAFVGCCLEDAQGLSRRNN